MECSIQEACFEEKRRRKLEGGECTWPRWEQGRARVIREWRPGGRGRGRATISETDAARLARSISNSLRVGPAYKSCNVRRTYSLGLRYKGDKEKEEKTTLGLP